MIHQREQRIDRERICIQPNVVLSVLTFVLIASGCGFKSEQADLIVHNATVITMDTQNTMASAMAIKDGRVIAIGAEREVLNKYSALQTTDARGGVIVPGLMDGHAHLVGFADGLLEANLFAAESWEETVQRVVEHDAARPNEWVVGRGWDQNDWELPRFPNSALLDLYFPEKPVVLERIDGHALIVNRVALERAGLWRTSIVSPEGGEIVKGEDGYPSGVLIDNACALIQKHVPQRAVEERFNALMEAQQTLLAQGLTSITDAGLAPSEILRLDSLHTSGDLKLRINAMVSAADSSIEWLRSNGPIRKDRLTVQSVKFYMDGALGSRGALLLEPYSDRPGWHGLGTQDATWFRSQLEALAQDSLQAATHCIGDSAVRWVLNAYQDILGGTNDRRWRIEHAQVVAPEDFDGFGRNSVIPSVQPTHATSDMYWAGERLGRNRIRRAYAYQELLRQLGMVALGTDFPVEDTDPRKTFFASVSRQDASGYPEGGFQSSNALSKEQTLRGMTQWVALAQFQEMDLGTIEIGKWADLTWMDRNWLTIAPADVLETRVLGTCIAGEWLYLAER